jgi:hypothetical protein
LRCNTGFARQCDLARRRWSVLTDPDYEYASGWLVIICALIVLARRSSAVRYYAYG